MIYSIFVLPNSADDWETSSPFSTLLSSGQLGYCFSVTTEDDLSDYKMISSKLLDVSDLDQSVNLFSGSPAMLSGSIALRGIGGVTSSSDFSFTLESSGITFNQLLGRSIKVAIDLTNTTAKDLGVSGVNVVFTGKIKKVNPKLNAVEFVCRGLLSQLKEREIGTVTNYDSEIYKSKIIPIVYGDFTDINAMVRTVLSAQVSKVPDIVIDNQAIESITDVLFYDSDNKKSLRYNEGDLSGLTISVDNKSIGLSYATDAVLLSAIDDSQGYIEIYNPPKIAFEISGSPTLDTTSIYHDADDHSYKFLEEKDGYYLFDTTIVSGVGYVPSTMAGTLTKDEGTGSATLSFTFHSEVLDADIYLEQSEMEYGIVAGNTNPLVLKIENEYVLVYHEDRYLYNGYGDNYGYLYSRMYVSRGYNSSTAASHLISTVISKLSSDLQSLKWEFKHYLYCSGVSNFGRDVLIVPRTGGVELESGDVKDLTKMYREGIKSTVYTIFKQVLDKTIYFTIDLQFPKLNIKADIIDAFILGSYLVDTGADFATAKSAIFIVQQGGTAHACKLHRDNGGDVSDFSMNFEAVGMMKKPPKSGVGYLAWVTFPYYLSSGVLYTVNFLAIMAPQTSGDPVNINYGFSTDIPNNYEDSFSLKNMVENNSGYIKNAILGDLTSFLNSKLGIRWYADSEECTMSIANPGLLLYLSVNPLESEVFIRGIGRGDLHTPQAILMDILDKELSFTNVNDSTVSRTSWKQALAINGDVHKFSDIAQSICEQGGLILSDNADGYLNIHDITILTSNSGLTNITAAVLEKSGMPAYTEEWTTIDQLITDINLSYARNDASETYGLLRATADITGMATKLSGAADILDADQKSTIELPYVRDTTTVDLLGNLVADYHKEPLRILNVELNFGQYALKIGQWVICNVASTGKVYLIVGVNINFDSGVTVRMIEFTLPT